MVLDTGSDRIRREAAPECYTHMRNHQLLVLDTGSDRIRGEAAPKVLRGFEPWPLSESHLVGHAGLQQMVVLSLEFDTLEVKDLKLET